MDKTEIENEAPGAAGDCDEFPEYIGGDEAPADPAALFAEQAERADRASRVLNAPAGESSTRFALLHKYDLVATLILKTTDDAGVIVRDDPREEDLITLVYETPGDALRHFDEGLRDSARNGWAVSFDGAPALG